MSLDPIIFLNIDGLLNSPRRSPLNAYAQIIDAKCTFLHGCRDYVPVLTWPSWFVVCQVEIQGKKAIHSFTYAIGLLARDRALRSKNKSGRQRDSTSWRGFRLVVVLDHNAQQ